MIFTIYMIALEVIEQTKYIKTTLVVTPDMTDRYMTI